MRLFRPCGCIFHGRCRACDQVELSLYVQIALGRDRDLALLFVFISPVKDVIYASDWVKIGIISVIFATMFIVLLFLWAKSKYGRENKVQLIMTPLVSVVIPTFNRGSFVRWAIQSALSQTHSAVEVIIVDDGSTDETEEVILAIKDPRVRYFRTGNQGNYCARNIGLEKAEGSSLPSLIPTTSSFLRKLPNNWSNSRRTRLLVCAAPTPISSTWEILTGF